MLRPNAASPLLMALVLPRGAGAQPKEGEPGCRTGAGSVDGLVRAVPGVERVASIRSQDMSGFVWPKLARRAAELLASPTRV